MEPIILGAGALALWAMSRRDKKAPTPKAPPAAVSPPPSVVPAPTPAAKLAETQRRAQERRLAEERETQRLAQERQQKVQRLAQERQQRTQRLAQERQQQLELRKAQLRSLRPAPTPVPRAAPAPVPRAVPARARAKFPSGTTVLVRGETPWKIQERRYNEQWKTWEYFFFSGWAWIEEKLLSPVPPRPPSTPFPVVGRDKWIGKLFVLIPKDNPLPARSEVVISDRLNMSVNWINQKMGHRLAFDPNPIYLTMPFTFAEIRRAAEGVHWNLTKMIFDWMQNETPYKPRGSSIGSRNQAWVLMVRGAGGWAGATPRGTTSEDVAWSVVGDAVLSAWLSEKGLERNICPDVIFLDHPYSSRLPSCTADAQTGAFVHEIFHACFDIIPHESRSVLAEWSWWWTVPILPKHKTKAVASGYLW